jgi:hypothetical protein
MSERIERNDPRIAFVAGALWMFTGMTGLTPLGRWRDDIMFEAARRFKRGEWAPQPDSAVTKRDHTAENRQAILDYERLAGE